MAIMRYYLHDPKFSHFDTIPECDRQTDGHTTAEYRPTTLSIASAVKTGCTSLKKYTDSAEV